MVYVVLAMRPQTLPFRYELLFGSDSLGFRIPDCFKEEVRRGRRGNIALQYRP
jgi:hypothetical protein